MVSITAGRDCRGTILYGHSQAVLHNNGQISNHIGALVYSGKPFRQGGVTLTAVSRTRDRYQFGHIVSEDAALQGIPLRGTGIPGGFQRYDVIGCHARQVDGLTGVGVWIQTPRDDLAVTGSRLESDLL